LLVLKKGVFKVGTDGGQNQRRAYGGRSDFCVNVMLHSS
jgi:hypothetical protein